MDVENKMVPLEKTNLRRKNENRQTDMLISFLELLDINSSEFKVKLNKDIFKNPDKDLFRKIMCFLLKTLGGFDDWLEQYSRPILITKIEAQFRNSLKDIVSQINQTWPKANNIKTINQSFLVAPRGAKIISFLISIARITVIVTCEEASGEEYVPPSSCDINSQIEKMKNIDYGELEKDLEAQIISLKSEFDDNQRKLSKVKDEFNCFINSDECDGELREDLKTSSDIDLTLLNWEKNIMEKIACEENSLDTIISLNQRLSNLKNQFDELISFQSTHLDGFEIMKVLGLKSNEPIQMKGIELIQDGKLNLHSFLKICCIHLKEFLSKELNISYIDDVIVRAEKHLNNLDKESKMLDMFKDQCEKLSSIYRPLVEEFCESTEAEKGILSNKHLQSLYICEQNKVPLNTADPSEKLIPSELTLPLSPEDLAQWVLGNNYISRFNDGGSVRKSICSKGSPAMVLKSGRKLRSLMMKGDKFNERSKRSIFSKAPLIGLNMDNRRATLASPQMARREHFRSHCTESKRKPLKALFTSSPLSNSKTCLSEKMSSFGEQSKVEVAEECLINLPSTSSTVNSFNSPKHRSLTIVRNVDQANIPLTSLLVNCFNSLKQEISSPTRPVISTPELLVWDKSSSDSEFSSPAHVEHHLLSPTSPLSSNQHNHSLDLLIEKFMQAKDNIT